MATRQEVLNAYATTPGAVANPDEAGINYWMQNGLGGFKSAVDEYNARNKPAAPTRADVLAYIDAHPDTNQYYEGNAPTARNFDIPGVGQIQYDSSNGQIFKLDANNPTGKYTELTGENLVPVQKSTADNQNWFDRASTAVAPYVMALGQGAVLGPLGGAVGSGLGLGSGLLGGSVGGALVNAGVSAVKGENVVQGAVLGAVGGAVSSVIKDLSGLTTAETSPAFSSLDAASMNAAGASPSDIASALESNYNYSSPLANEIAAAAAEGSSVSDLTSTIASALSNEETGTALTDGLLTGAANAGTGAVADIPTMTITDALGGGSLQGLTAAQLAALEGSANGLLSNAVGANALADLAGTGALTGLTAAQTAGLTAGAGGALSNAVGTDALSNLTNTAATTAADATVNPANILTTVGQKAGADSLTGLTAAQTAALAAGATGLLAGTATTPTGTAQTTTDTGTKTTLDTLKDTAKVASLLPGLAKLGSSDLSGLLSSGAGALLANSNANTLQGIYNTEANKVTAAAAQQAPNYQFSPVGITTRFGSATPKFDANGKLTGYDYGATSDIAAQRDQLLKLSQQALPSTTDPTQIAQNYITQQQGLLAPEQQQVLATIQAQMAATGRSGLATGATSGAGVNLAATNPQLAAYYNSLAQQNAQLASNAPTYAQNLLNSQINTSGLLSGQANTLEGYAQQPITLGTQLGTATTAGTTNLANSNQKAALASAALQAEGANAAYGIKTAAQTNLLSNLTGSGTGDLLGRAGSAAYDWLTGKTTGATPDSLSNLSASDISALQNAASKYTDTIDFSKYWTL